MYSDNYWWAQRVADAEFARIGSQEKATMKIYISNPISGILDHRARATTWAERVRQLGGLPIIPQDIPPHAHDGQCPKGYTSNPEGHSSACHLHSDIKALLECDAILMVPGWPNSRGCRFERYVAQMCGLKVYIASPYSETIYGSDGLFQVIDSLGD